MCITTRPGARLFDSFVWRIIVSHRAINDMSGHVKVLACILFLKVMSSLLIRYFDNRLSRKVFMMNKNWWNQNKVLKVCHSTVGWMTLKLNTHDMIMCHSVKLVLISQDKSSSSQNDWNGRKLLIVAIRILD